MAEYYDADDPFGGGEKLPSLSWKALPIGATFHLTILEPAKLLQSTDFETQKPAFWDEEKTKPIMCAVLNVEVVTGPHSEGQLRSIWAQIPSNMFITLKNAQKEAGAKFQEGGTLHVKFVGEEPHKQKGYNPIKQYAAKYIPPVAPAGSDVFDDEPAPLRQTTRTVPTPPPQTPRQAPSATRPTGSPATSRKW